MLIDMADTKPEEDKMMYLEWEEKEEAEREYDKHVTSTLAAKQFNKLLGKLQKKKTDEKVE